MKQCFRIQRALIIMDNIFFVVKPFWFILCGLGFFPLSFNEQIANGVLVLKKHGVVASCLNAAFSITLIALNIMNSFNFLGVSAFLNVLFRMQAVLGSLLNLMQFFYQIHKRRNIVNILSALDCFDKKVY